MMKMNTAPMENNSSINAKAATPHAPAGAAASSNQPLPQKAKPITKLFPGPKRRVMRWPSTLANT